MLTGDIRSKVDKVWDTFWTGGISNPLTVIEQLSYLLFIKRLDEIHTSKEKKANRFNEPIQDPVFTVEQEDYRWSRFKNLDAQSMFEIISNKVFPFIKNMGHFEITDQFIQNFKEEDLIETLKNLLNKSFNNKITFEDELRKLDISDKQIRLISEQAINTNHQYESTYSKYMKDAIFMVQNPSLLQKVVELIDNIPMADRDTKGDLYEYLLSKLTTSGMNGQFRTPRHIIKMMIEMMKPTPHDLVCDPACGTAGFLVAVNEYMREKYPEVLTDNDLKKHFENEMFNGYDFDSTMLRIGSMNMMLHGIENPNIIAQDSLSEGHKGDEQFSLILANPPFKGSLDEDSVAKSLLQVVKTPKTELLFLALILRLLKVGGRAAVIIPDGILFGSSKAHLIIRQKLVEEHKLEAIISMPSGVFKPYAGVSTGILIFTKTNSGGTDKVWFYDMKADGYSLDDKRTKLDSSDHEKDNIADIISRWNNRDNELERKRSEQSFFVDKADIVANKYDLSINRYKEVIHEKVNYEEPKVILAEIQKAEKKIQQELDELAEILS